MTGTGITRLTTTRREVGRDDNDQPPLRATAHRVDGGCEDRRQQNAMMATTINHSTPNCRSEQLLLGWKWGARGLGRWEEGGGSTMTTGRWVQSAPLHPAASYCLWGWKQGA